MTIISLLQRESTMLTQLFTQAKMFFSHLGVRQEKGQGLIEYALIILLISIVVIAVLGFLGDELNLVFQEVLDTFRGTP